MRNILCILAILWLALGNLPAQGQSALGLMSGKAAADPADQRTSEQELQELMRLLSNPVLMEQLKQRLPETSEQGAGESLSVSGLQQHLQATLTLVEQRAQEIVHALTTLPQWQAIQRHLCSGVPAIPPQALDLTPNPFLPQAPLAAGNSGSGRPARPTHDKGDSQQHFHADQGALQVAGLLAVLAAHDPQPPLPIEPSGQSGGDAQDALVTQSTLGSIEVQTQIHLALHLVHVLPTGPARAGEAD